MTLLEGGHYGLCNNIGTYINAFRGYWEGWSKPSKFVCRHLWTPLWGLFYQQHRMWTCDVIKQGKTDFLVESEKVRKFVTPESGESNDVSGSLTSLATSCQWIADESLSARTDCTWGEYVIQSNSVETNSVIRNTFKYLVCSSHFYGLFLVISNITRL